MVNPEQTDEDNAQVKLERLSEIDRENKAPQSPLMPPQMEHMDQQPQQEQERTEPTEQIEERGRKDEDCDDGEDYTPLSHSENPEELNAYKEYKRLVTDINYQNELLEQIKCKIKAITQKKCPTPSEKKDLKELHLWLEQEMKKLRTLIERAIHLQNFGSKRQYKEFQLATTYDEDNMNPFLHICENMRVQTAKWRVKSKTDHGWRASGGDSSELDKSCSCLEEHSSRHKKCQSSEGDEKKLLKEIIETLKICTAQTKQPLPCKQHPRPPCKKNDSLESVKDKLSCMQQTLSKLTEEFCKREHKNTPFDPCKWEHKNNLFDPCGPEKTQDITCTKKPPIDTTLLCLKSGSKAENFEKLKDNYIYLLTEYSKKDEQLKELLKK